MDNNFGNTTPNEGNGFNSQPVQPQAPYQQPVQPQAPYQQPVQPQNFQQPVMPQQGTYNYNAGQQMNQYGYQQPGMPVPGKNKAVASLVLGIVSVVFWFFGMGAVIGLAAGIVGIVMAVLAKKEGFVGGMQMAGFICSIIGAAGSAIAFIACLACYAAYGSYFWWLY